MVSAQFCFVDPLPIRARSSRVHNNYSVQDDRMADILRFNANSQETFQSVSLYSEDP